MRHRRQLAALEPHRGNGPRLGLLQLLPHHALLTSTAWGGTRPSASCWTFPRPSSPGRWRTAGTWGWWPQGCPIWRPWPACPSGAWRGDQQAALFGQGCFAPGQLKNTYGTGCFTLMNTGTAPVTSQNGLLTCVGWGLGGETTYVLEGSVFNAGSSIQWLRDELGLIEKASDCDVLAEQVPDNGGVYLVSAFTGLGAPHWDMYARGAVVASPGAPPGPISSGPPWRASPTRPPTSSPPWSGTRGRRSPPSGPTAGPASVTF